MPNFRFQYQSTCSRTVPSVSSRTSVRISAGERICQGIFLPFGVTEDEAEVTAERRGGYGSTGR